MVGATEEELAFGTLNDLSEQDVDDGYDTDQTIPVSSDDEDEAGSPGKREREQDTKEPPSKRVKTNSQNIPIQKPYTKSKLPRAPYRCNKCKQVKRGHQCPFAHSQNPLPSPTPRSASTSDKLPQIMHFDPAAPSLDSFSTFQANTAYTCPSLPTVPSMNFSLGWFDVAVQALGNLRENLKVIPAEEWEHHEPLSGHLSESTNYLEAMRDEFQRIQSSATSEMATEETPTTPPN